MQIVKAPNRYEDLPHPWMFLAGSIEMGAAEKWQDVICQNLMEYNGTILNPLREDWDSSWIESKNNPQFRDQVGWELDGQAESDIIVFYFDPKSKSPITLMEFGMFGPESDRQIIVCCPEGFWKKGNVDIVCERHQLQTEPELHDLVDALRREVDCDLRPIT